MARAAELRAGYQEAIRLPTLEEQRLLNGAAARLAGRELLTRRLFSTTLNINGLWSGYAGAGMKTILPHVASARLDSRLVPKQTPDAQLELIRKHLDARGFRDVTLRRLSGYPPAQSEEFYVDLLFALAQAGMR